MVGEDHSLRYFSMRVGLRVVLHLAGYPLYPAPFTLPQVPPRPRVLRAYKTVLVAPNAWLEELFRFLVEGTGVRDLRCRRRWGVEGGRRGLGSGSGDWDGGLSVRHFSKVQLEVSW